MIRSKLFARSALGVVLALGVASAGLVSPAQAKEKEKAPAAVKISPSKAFIPAYAALKTALDNLPKRADVTEAKAKVAAAEAAARAAQGSKARADARAAVDAATAALGALLQPEKTLLDQAYAVATVPDDKFLAGQIAINLGNTGSDKQLQRRGILSVIESGRLSPAEAAKYHFFVGGLSFDMKEYATARSEFQAAIAGGYTENGVESLLAEAYFNDNQPAEGLKVLQDATIKHGTAPVEWLKRGVVVAYRAKLPDQGAFFSSQLVSLYPARDNWTLAIAVVRDLNKFQQQELIDLMRLMERTNSFSEGRDYVDYVQAADPRRLPGEAIKILDKGLAAGKLDPKDVFVTDSRSIAAPRIAADKTSLIALEKDARAPNSTAATAMAAGDAFLSYDDVAKAESLYQIALGKPGVDSERVLTRLGIAQVDQGKAVEAQATFAKVDGVRKPIAMLWMAYAKSKVPAPAPAAAPTS